MIQRVINDGVQEGLYKGKVIILSGARQVGKTTLVKSIIAATKRPHLYVSGDDSDIREILQDANSIRIKQFLGDTKLLVIDEAQRIKNIGLTLKIIVDNYPEVQVIATGSSSFELANRINEPLTGRKIEYFLYPISYQEMVTHTDSLTEHRLLENRIIYGYYPEIVMNPGNEINILKSLAGSYMYKDIFDWETIKKPAMLEKLLQALALQIGNQVSYNELANTLGIDKETVERYIDLLEKSYIIFTLTSLSRNMRNELKKSKKIYFFDNGIRNALIRNFNPLDLRMDKGALWENFLIVERLKLNEYKRKWTNRFFWRTYSQKEIDYIEEYNGTLYAYEFKWKSKKNKIPKTFLDNYKNAEYKVIDKDNYREFIMS